MHLNGSLWKICEDSLHIEPPFRYCKAPNMLAHSGYVLLKVFQGGKCDATATADNIRIDRQTTTIKGKNKKVSGHREVSDPL